MCCAQISAGDALAGKQGVASSARNSGQAQITTMNHERKTFPSTESARRSKRPLLKTGCRWKAGCAWGAESTLERR